MFLCLTISRSWTKKHNKERHCKHDSSNKIHSLLCNSSNTDPYELVHCQNGIGADHVQHGQRVYFVRLLYQWWTKRILGFFTN